MVAGQGVIPFTPEADAVLKTTREEAYTLGQEHVGTEHLLLALLRGEDDVAARALKEAHVSLADARERVQAFSEPEDGWEPK